MADPSSSTRTLADYRPQHDADCAIHDGICGVCGHPPRTLHGLHPQHPPGPNPNGHLFRSTNTCTCGLVLALASLVTSEQEQVEAKDSIMMAIKADRAAICAFILDCREKCHTVQVFDVLADAIANGNHLPPLPAPPTETQ